MRRALLYLLVVPVAALLGVGSAYALKWWLVPEVRIDQRLPERRAYDWRARAAADSTALSAPVALLPDEAPPKADLSIKTGVPKDANTGTLARGSGVPSDEAGSWSGFRGDNRTNVAPAEEKLLREWPPTGPEVLWTRELGIGHAAAAVRNGRVYLIDYDKDRREDTIRCLSLADGREIWAYSYYVYIKNYHGISRTVPAVNDEVVVTLGPLCHVTCLDAKTGERRWQLDLVKDFAADVPEWYAGQCPLIEGGRVILAPGGDPLMMAVDLADGKIAWRTPNLEPPRNPDGSRNPDSWRMTHSSIMPMEYKGVRHYVYPATKGVVGVRASDGKLLWKTTAWTVPTAAIASPVVVDGDRVLFSGGYKAGAAMFRLTGEPDEIEPVEAWRITDDRIFGAPQQTPILYGGYLYSVVQRGSLVCLDLDGKVKWTSGREQFFLGPFLIADGMILIVSEDKGTLHLVEASPNGFKQVAQAKVLDGANAWGPMALVDGKLLLRDQTTMKCVRVGYRK